jgi:hypothetical protein
MSQKGMSVLSSGKSHSHVSGIPSDVILESFEGPND